MQTLLRWLAARQGLDVDPGSELHLALDGFPSGGLGLLVLLGIALALWVVIHAYRRDAHRLSTSRRVLLTALRAAAVLLACLLLLDPQVVAVRSETHPGHTLLLIDSSQSMARADAFAEPAVAELAEDWRSLGAGDLAATPRLDLARLLLDGSGEGDGAGKSIVDRLRADNELLVYRFAAGLEPLGRLPLRSDDDRTDPAAEAFRQQLAEFEADGSYTNLGTAVRDALRHSAQSNVAGLILLTDGRRNLGAAGAEIAGLLRNRGVPHTLVVPIGDPSPSRTLQILRVDAPDRVFQQDPFTIRVSIESEGYQDQQVELLLSRQGEGETKPAVIRSELLQVSSAQPEHQISFEGLLDEAPGRATWSVTVLPPGFEAFAAERHLQRVSIEVLDERTKVLLIAGGPSPEYRILRNLLTRDDTIDLSCWLSSADPEFPQDGNSPIDGLPSSAEEFEAFDLLVMLDPDSRRLDRGFCELAAAQIISEGTGLWWVCGEKHSLEAMRRGASTEALVALLPVVPDVEKADQSVGLARGMPRTSRYLVTAAGLEHKATRIADDRSTSEAIWSRVPGFYFAFPVLRAKPAANVLVERADAGGDRAPQPLIATQFVGAGRVLFSATDDLYRWRSIFEDAYDRLWVKGLRYLFEGKLAAGDSRLRITLDQERVELGEALHVQVQARALSGDPLRAERFELRLVDPDGDSETLVLRPIEAAAGQFEAWLRPRRPGWYRLESTGASETRAEQGFAVVPAALEKPGPVDLAELAAIAAVEGGVLVERPSGLRDAVDAIDSETRIETFRSAAAVWDSWTTIAALLGLLATEWWLRKRSNLL